MVEYMSYAKMRSEVLKALKALDARIKLRTHPVVSDAFTLGGICVEVGVTAENYFAVLTGDYVEYETSSTYVDAAANHIYALLSKGGAL